MKTVQHMLRHAQGATTSDTSTSMLDEVTRAAARDLANAIPHRTR